MSNIHLTRADLIYKIKNKDVYFVLLEFQSTEDSNMPYRLLSYMLEIWRRYGEEKLPLVIPCVLYTGNKKWKVKTFRSLFNVSKELEKYIPDFEYVLIDVNNYTDEELIETANLVSSVVYMAKVKDKNEIADKLENIISLIKRLSIKEQNAFVRWAEVMFSKCGKVHDYFEENLYKKEANDMLLVDLMPEALEVIRERARTKAREEGRELGLTEGRELGLTEGRELGLTEGRDFGRREQLKRILIKKLKSEPSEEIKILLENATEEITNKIEDKIFEIESWKEVEDIIKF